MYLKHLMKVTVSKHFRGQQFVEFDNFLRKSSGYQDFGFADELIFVFLYLWNVTHFKAFLYHWTKYKMWKLCRLMFTRCYSAAAGQISRNLTFAPAITALKFVQAMQILQLRK